MNNYNQFNKLISTNPDKYKTISDVEAWKGYASYLKAYINSIESLDLDPGRS